MAGLVPAIYFFLAGRPFETWMAATGAAMTNRDKPNLLQHRSSRHGHKDGCASTKRVRVKSAKIRSERRRAIHLAKAVEQPSPHRLKDSRFLGKPSKA